MHFTMVNIIVFYAKLTNRRYTFTIENVHATIVGWNIVLVIFPSENIHPILRQKLIIYPLT